jgi:hypothetical protein
VLADHKPAKSEEVNELYLKFMKNNYLRESTIQPLIINSIESSSLFSEDPNQASKELIY